LLGWLRCKETVRWFSQLSLFYRMETLGASWAPTKDLVCQEEAPSKEVVCQEEAPSKEVVCLHLPSLFRMPPYHLAHYELSYHVVSVPLGWMRLVYTALTDIDDGFEVTAAGVVYVRMWRDHAGMYSVGLTYSPWPAYAVDPIRLGTWHTSLAEALAGTHQVYRQYRQESVRPVPIMDVFDAYEFGDEAMWVLEGSW